MRFIIGLLAAAACLAQTPAAPLVYGGKPLALRSDCRPELLSAAGLACTEDDPCPLYLELTGAELLGTRVLAAGNLHTSSTTLESVLLASEDGGVTWTEPHPRIPQASLDHIQFVGFERGWIAGQTLLALPREPFFLITSDGGRTWRKQTIFSEPRVGTIDYFRFSTGTQGTMIIDRLQAAENGIRYEEYVSETGGDTWTLRQASAKAPVKPRESGESALRIRADAATRVLRLEKRAGSGWQLLSSFSVAAGECRAEEPALPDAPEAPVEPEPAAPVAPKGKRGR